MLPFVPQRVYPSYHFDIKPNRHGYWIVREGNGLVGGTFLTRKDAERFALFESGGDSARVHTYPKPKPAHGNRVPARRRTRVPS
jgi:hypothetical protein